MRTTFAVLAVVALVAATGALAEDRYVVHKTPGTFTIDSFSFDSVDDRPWEDGTIVRVRMTGVCKKKLTAGTLKFKLYESFVQHFESSGNLPYFKCTNKGCDTAQGETLFLEDPTADESRYTLEFDFTMATAEKTGIFSLVIWGADQSHTPYDFSVTVDYNYTYIATPTAAPAAVPALRGSAPAAVPELATPAPANSIMLPFQYNVSNGNMTIDSVTCTSNTNKWEAGAVVTVTMKGSIPSKHILAGTLKYKIYESFVQYFIASGNFPYFKCDNKGCDPSDGIALHLNDPTTVPTAFTMSCQITIPKSIANGKNPFNLLLYGVDQDHWPIDFNVAILYNLSD